MSEGQGIRPNTTTTVCLLTVLGGGSYAVYNLLSKYKQYPVTVPNHALNQQKTNNVTGAFDATPIGADVETQSGAASFQKKYDIVNFE